MNFNQASELFQAKVAEGALVGFCCTSCGRLAVPPSAFCPGCLDDRFDAQPLTGRGCIEGFSTVGVGKTRDPIRVAYVQLQEGPRIACQLAPVAGLRNPETEMVGKPVQLTASRDPACLTFRLETSSAEQA